MINIIYGRGLFIPLALFIALTVVGVVSTLQSQVVSSWPHLDGSYSGYKTPFECNAAVNRARNNFGSRSNTDTMSPQQDLLNRHLPEEVREVARLCAKQINIDRLTKYELIPMMALYLKAGQEQDAEKMVTRFLESNYVPSKSEPAKTESDKELEAQTIQIHELALHTYLRTNPARLDAVWKHLQALEKLQSVKPLRLLSHYYSTFRRSLFYDNSGYAAKAAKKVTELTSQLSSSEKQSVYRELFHMQQELRKEERLDSLRRSTMGYVELQKSLVRNLLSEENEMLFIGDRMDTLEGEFRFPSMESIPAEGMVSIIVIPGIAPSVSVADSVFHMLRRIKRKFSDLEVVYSTRTTGSFQGQAMPAAEEAEEHRRWVQEFWGMPFTVLVERSPVVRLPDPDGRQFYMPTPNIDRYGGRLWLVDKKGTIVYYGRFTKAQENDLLELLDALYQQKN